MPELPDVELYLDALRRRIVGQPLESVRLASPFLVRSIDPPLDRAVNRVVRGLRRLGKRIVWELDGDLFIVIHLMIAGRFRWKERGAGIPGKIGLAAFDFPNGTLLLTEAGSKRQASLHVAAGERALASHDPGGIEPLDASLEQFAQVLRRENHTIKRSLTDPHLLSGIGNAYSDEILHAARMSPMKLTSQMGDAEIERLYAATIDTLSSWRQRLLVETGDNFPEKVTAFRDGMAVHGRYGKPCPVCEDPVQRIRYAANEANYCPTCQTGGKLLADRSLSRLLKDDWPRSIDELEKRMRR
uniref:Putative formamidopyrimidine-DNA glycosylase n=1 Tax=uncultured Acidobacteriota bacterium TaxID=171953 RepID=Q7X345_9BACT|nr:putative formamidopyrimidine-DNA glycosylase [uncultured Acidobacteriota bacterium]